MKGRLASLLAAMALAQVHCDTSDRVVEGARRDCAFGGTLTDDCDEPIATAEDACWRLVDCGAIALEVEEENRFDWGECVDELEDLVADRERAVIACIATSTCDELRVSDHCGRFGE